MYVLRVCMVYVQSIFMRYTMYYGLKILLQIIFKNTKGAQRIHIVTTCIYYQWILKKCLICKLYKYTFHKNIF